MNSERFGRYLERITDTVARAVFVKVGANDGVSGDPCGRLFLDQVNWSGVLIEPVPHLYQRLTQSYSDPRRFITEQVAIGTCSGRRIFYYVGGEAKSVLPDLPDEVDMLGSFDRSHIVGHLNGTLEPFIVGMELEVLTLAEILGRNHIQELHLLQIDTEGYDLEVIKSLDFAAVAPQAIYIEHKHLSSEDRTELEQILEGHSYRIYDCGNDLFAERKVS